MDMNMNQEHEDFEKKFQLSTSVNFSSDQQEFQGLEILKVEIKEKIQLQQIENIELRKRKRKTERNSLF